MRPDGVKFFRTQSPRHFEGGDWDQGGSCQHLQPLLLEQVSIILYYVFIERCIGPLVIWYGMFDVTSSQDNSFYTLHYPIGQGLGKFMFLKSGK